VRLENTVTDNQPGKTISDWRLVAGTALLYAAGILILHGRKHGGLGDRPDELLAGFLALGLVVGITVCSLIFRHGLWIPMHPTISSLGTTALRLLTVLLALGLATATKWNNANSFCSHLLGCYFIFLVLESCLSARWYSSRSRDLPS